MLTGKQKRLLRAMGSVIDPVVQVGKGGISGQVIDSVDEALAARELIKIKVLQNCPLETAEAIAELARAVQAELVQVIGRNGLLYKQNTENPKIDLP